MLNVINKKNILLVTVSVFTGITVAFYSALVNNSPLLMMALPLVMTLSLLLIVDKKNLVLIILLFRSSLDVLFQSSKFDAGIGLGALINAFIILIAILFIIERPKMLNRSVTSIWAAVLIVAFIEIFNAPALVPAIRLYLAFFSYFAVFIIACYLIRSKQDFNSCINIVLLSSILPVLYSFFEIATGIGNYSHDAFRIKSTFTHANIFAFYLVLMLSLIFYRIKIGATQLTSGYKLLIYLYIAILLILLILTKTRSAWIACYLMFAVYGMYLNRKMLIYLILIPVVAFLVPDVRERLLDLSSGNEYIQYARLNSYAWRLLLWESGLNWMEAIRYPFGYGLGSFSYYSPIFFPLEGRKDWESHSLFVQWIFEAGIIGTTCLLWMFFKVIKTLHGGYVKEKTRTVVLLTLVAQYLAISYSDNIMYYLSFNWYFWFIIGAGCAVAVLQNEGKQ